MLLKIHVGVGNFRHWCEIEEDDEEGYKAGYTQVNPLDILEALSSVDCVCKEYTRCEERSNERPNALEALSQIETNLGVFWGTTDGQKRIRTYFEG